MKDYLYIILGAVFLAIGVVSFLLPNNLTNSELPCTIFVNSLQVPLGNYSNLSNYTIECYLRDNNGVISSISTFPDY